MSPRIRQSVAFLLLLCWQLSATPLVHAALSAPATVTAPVAAEPACAGHAADTTPAPAGDPAVPDCCKSLACDCPCMQVPALSMTLPHLRTPAPVPLLTALHVGLCPVRALDEFLRPPI